MTLMSAQTIRLPRTGCIKWILKILMVRSNIYLHKMCNAISCLHLLICTDDDRDFFTCRTTTAVGTHVLMISYVSVVVTPSLCPLLCVSVSRVLSLVEICCRKLSLLEYGSDFQKIKLLLQSIASLQS